MFSGCLIACRGLLPRVVEVAAPPLLQVPLQRSRLGFAAMLLSSPGPLRFWLLLSGSRPLRIFFTTIVVFDSVQTTPHRDQQNSFLPNLVVPVSSFTQGSIWVQSCNGPSTRMIDGAELRGVSLPVCDGPVLFDARRSVHLTDAWTGRRVVLVAFSMSAIDKLSPEAAARLTTLRFALPSHDDVEHFRKYPQLPVRLPWPPRFPLQVVSSAEVPLQATAACPTVVPPPKEPLFLELCAGTAMLSRCFREAGVPVMPIDHQHNRHHPLAKVCNLSLTEDSTWNFLRDLVQDHAILFVHAAPPCGTCSASSWAQSVL